MTKKKETEKLIEVKAKTVKGTYQKWGTTPHGQEVFLPPGHYWKKGSVYTLAIRIRENIFSKSNKHIYMDCQDVVDGNNGGEIK